MLVDAEFFGWSLVERLLSSPAATRRRILWPLETKAEQAILNGLDESYTDAQAVAHALAELDEAFDTREFDALSAVQVAKTLRSRTFLRDPLPMLRARPDAFPSAFCEALVRAWDSSDEPF